VNRFTSLVGCRLPLQLAGMGGVGTVELAAAVARAGGLGMLPALGESAGVRVRAALEAGGTGAVIGVNVLMPFLGAQRPAIDEAIAAGARVVEFFYDDPTSALVSEVHDAGALVSWQVGSVAEARSAAASGCDLVVAQGLEAGGHVRGTTPLFDLLELVVAADLGVPVVAAGGMTTAEHIATALDLGADAVRLGTRFLATPEADVHPVYVDALLAASGDDTVLTTAFAAGWPDAPHRVLRSCVDAADALPFDTPNLHSPAPPTRHHAGDPLAAALYAGTGVGAVTAVEPAEELATRLMREAAALRATS
jgi:nitronate monooxygenase